MRSSETKDGSLFEIHEGPEEETDLQSEYQYYCLHCGEKKGFETKALKCVNKSSQQMVTATNSPYLINGEQLFVDCCTCSNLAQNTCI